MRANIKTFVANRYFQLNLIKKNQTLSWNYDHGSRCLEIFIYSFVIMLALNCKRKQENMRAKHTNFLLTKLSSVNRSKKLHFFAICHSSLTTNNAANPNAMCINVVTLHFFHRKCIISYLTCHCFLPFAFIQLKKWRKKKKKQKHYSYTLISVA